MTGGELRQEKMATWKAFLRAYATVIGRLAQEMQETQALSLTWYDVLVHLNNDARGGLRLQDLAQAIVLSQSGLTRLLDRMEEAGLVERKPCPHDRRGAYAAITPAGKAALAQAAPVHLRGIEEHFMRYLSPEEIAALHKAFSKILAGEAESA